MFWFLFFYIPQIYLRGLWNPYDTPYWWQGMYKKIIITEQNRHTNTNQHTELESLMSPLKVTGVLTFFTIRRVKKKLKAVVGPGVRQDVVVKSLYTWAAHTHQVLLTQVVGTFRHQSTPSLSPVQYQLPPSVPGPRQQPYHREMIGSALLHQRQLLFGPSFVGTFFPPKRVSTVCTGRPQEGQDWVNAKYEESWSDWPWNETTARWTLVAVR